MKIQNITLATILLVLGCFSLSPAVKAGSDSRQPTTFTQIDAPGASFTIAESINLRGDIVGDFTDSSGNEHGYLLSK